MIGPLCIVDRGFEIAAVVGGYLEASLDAPQRPREALDREPLCCAAGRGRRVLRPELGERSDKIVVELLRRLRRADLSDAAFERLLDRGVRTPRGAAAGQQHEGERCCY